VRGDPVSARMRILSLTYPGKIEVELPKVNWLGGSYHTLLTWIHGGVHPQFNLAASELYHQSVRKNLQCRNASLELLADSPLKARLYFYCFVRTRPLVKFTEYHSLELNTLDSALLAEIYGSIDQINRIKRSILRWRSNDRIKFDIENFSQADTFKLLSLLAQVTFEKA